MSDLTVIYDPTLEIGAIVDLDTNTGWGPMCPGPHGGELLQSFVDGMPFDITILTPEQARDIFQSVFGDQAAEDITATAAPAGSSVEPTGDPVADAATQGGGGPVEETSSVPPAQPADTDMAANTSQTNQVDDVPPTVTAPIASAPTSTGVSSDAAPQVNCLVCNANGQGSNNPACPVCGGTGKVPVPS